MVCKWEVSGTTQCDSFAGLKCVGVKVVNFWYELSSKHSHIAKLMLGDMVVRTGELYPDTRSVLLPSLLGVSVMTTCLTLLSL